MPSNAEDEEKELQTFLQEIRIVVPGAQVVGAFLFSLPFQQRFTTLGAGQRYVFILIFATTVLALILFLSPAVYHRVVYPIHEKRKFVSMGTRFLIAGFVALMVSIVLSTYLVASMVLSVPAAILLAAGFGVLVLFTWWAMPVTRSHERAKTTSADQVRS